MLLYESNPPLGKVEPNIQRIRMNGLKLFKGLAPPFQRWIRRGAENLGSPLRVCAGSQGSQASRESHTNNTPRSP